VTTEDEDAAFIDRLYGGEDVGGLGTVRGLIARVREEQPGVEPPQAIGARLLLAAQEHAPKKAAASESRPGVWARLSAWMRPVIAHPGMAAAATLVVVAGATAVWMSRGGKVEEPTIRQEARAPAEEADGEAAGSGLVAGADTATVTTESAPAAAVPDLDEKQQAAPARTSTSTPTTKTPSRDVRAPAKKRATPELAKETASGGGAGRGVAFGDSAADDSLQQEPAAGVKAKVGAPAQQPSAPPPPPAPAPDKPTEAKKNDEAPPSRVRQLFDQARAAAKQGDCERVEALGAEVKKLDASYYAKTFSTDASISACRKPTAE
jgi:hypothetical protein